jgi:hypothetical protein
LGLAIALIFPGLAGSALAREPGLDTAAPRFAISLVDQSISFPRPSSPLNRGTGCAGRAWPPPSACAVDPGYLSCTVTTAQAFTPTLGDGDTGFTDTTTVGTAKVLYYLVMNKF